MNKYHHIVIQRSIKQELKLKSFYLLDLVAIFGPSLILLYIQGQGLLPLPFLNMILLGLLLMGVALFLCMKPASNGGRRNVYTLLCLLKMDRQIYSVQSYRTNNKVK